MSQREPDTPPRGASPLELDNRAWLLARLAGAGLCRADAAGRLLTVDETLATMLGYALPDDLLAVGSLASLHLDQEEADRLQVALAGAPVVEGLEARWRRRDGSVCAVRISSHALAADDRSLSVRELIVEDLSRAQQREAQHRRNERLAGLGSALAAIAHELNNPLTAIMGFAQLLLTKPSAPGDRAALETISREAARSAKIVRDLLTLTSRRDVDRRTPVRLDEVVEYVVQTRRYAQEARGIRCTLDLEPGLPRVIGDRTQLEQMVLNLVSNAEQAIRAARASNQGHASQVTVRARSEADAVVIEVEDDGSGIPAEVRSRIWEPFWTSRSGVGVGLGLAVVHAIVTDHGGRIDIASGMSGGTRFLVRLPALARGGDAGNASEAPRALDVLVAESSDEERRFLFRLLTSRGHAVLEAANTTEAMRLVRRMQFDVVVCSAALAGDDETLSALRDATRGESGSRLRPPRVIVAAGSPNSTSRLPVPLPAGISVIMQPYDVGELLHLLEEQ